MRQTDKRKDTDRDNVSKQHFQISPGELSRVSDLTTTHNYRTLHSSFHEMATTKPPHPAAVLLLSTLLTIYAATAATTTTSTIPAKPPDCPKQCTCTDNNLTVDCSSRGFFRLPALSGLTTKLDLSGNLLGPMINGSFEHLRHLREIDLSGNGLLRLQLCTFTGLLHLRKVDLHGNRLRGLPSSLFADNGDLQALDLSHNELDALPDLLLHTVPHLKAGSLVPCT